MQSNPFPEQLAILKACAKWLALAAIVATLAGTASAWLLLALDWATGTREANRWLIWLLPLAGFAVGWVYLKFGRQVEAGNNLLIDEIHDPKKVIPLRMAPLVLGGTIISHLFGASVGREGTAVQMGGALADQLTHLFRLQREDRRILLMAGISAGFASVFGTPLAGAVFGLEVLAIGRLRYDAILPCFVAAIIADRVGLLWGVHHTHYVAGAIPALSTAGFFGTLAAGAIFGLTGMLFARATHRLSRLIKHHVAYAPLRPLLGGAVLAVVIYVLGAYRYTGLGIPVIVESFQHPVAPWDFAAKFAFTVASLSAGFKGGEVTPLFYIGATLGNALAPLLHMPFPLLAALGFVAVFAGAANTPLASTLMAMELFGPEIGVYAGLACVMSYLFSGHTGIYHAQRLGQGKHLTASPGEPDQTSPMDAKPHNSAD
ncbi:voltage-gated chloride channel family protein [Andreprevotia chitinilytica]|uniref:voltage-gated chloride channel family protein n=1 Tax=Andreprevotia chitinilytica TaxID=396808 RepID=UPI00068AF946|nr:voltage-gated chloride channel family protein [Andreprevotia chitinilytica]